MGTVIPKQHPAVVLRSQFNLVRGLLAVAMVALIGLTIAVVILANENEDITTTRAGEAAPVIPNNVSRLPAYPTPAPESVSPGSSRDYSGAAPTRKLDGSTDIPRSAPVPPGTRYDGGPEEGTSGTLTSPLPPGTRYDGGPEEGTHGPLGAPATPESIPEESQAGPGFRTD
jgi:hypothetical protein